MNESVKLVEDLVERFPVLRDEYECHLFNYGGLLEFVFFIDLAREVVDAFVSGGEISLDWRGVLEFLEKRIKTADREVLVVLVTGFLYHLPFPGQVGYLLVDELGPAMSRRLRALRSQKF